MIGRIMFIGLLIAFVASAIMFDWFSARDWASKALSTTEQTVEDLGEKGDSIKQFIESHKK
ncbi:hypothetical protein [Thiomicrospira microaerophila]|uniref:hypothetical protein n=1 Tax=Thiomicrospira microaerophila TaxID=406020 RepID=UPI0005C9D518|nr:hypothetical protein [Thiomicrospira microaerophila]